MIPIKSNVEGKDYSFKVLEDTLKPLGYSVGGNWDYDKGFFDYKINDDGAYHFFRVPFQAVDGELDGGNPRVRIGTPFLLAHEYQDGVDKGGNIGNVSASVNQFQSPEDKDAPIDSEYLKITDDLIAKLEEALL
ncbi:YugN-like family protein [Bacillus sp. FJAT-27445]|uniref:YugN-like family protein n=1 Tax=Bacillus sp. FJAT-27445 TaxID=1679166 RepID=UPI00074375B5|nr:YugN-like family protein [Bacillus sp. FJAT-27445]